MKRYIRLLVYVSLIYITIVLTASSFFNWYIWPLKSPELSEQWKTITHPQYGFSVDYPTKWTAQIFGKYGYRGTNDLKLSIYRNTFLGLDMFEIEIWYHPAESPTLDDVVKWGDIQIAQKNRNLRERGNEQYKEIKMWTSSIDDNSIIQRRFGNSAITYEDTYIAREHDMIIIRYQNETDRFENVLTDVERVIQSFRPLE